MSKSMAIDGVMKIFLMVAVIIVGMSFLMKAFGIDLIGWLMDKLGGLGIPDAGKILYVKLDPGDKPPEAFSVYLALDNPIQKIEHAQILTIGIDDYFAYFMVDKDKPQFKDNCLIYTVDEIGAASRTIEARDEAFIYYVKAGTVIQNQGCTSLGNCLSGKIVVSGCVEGKERSNFCEISGAGLGDLDKCYEKKKEVFTTVNCYCEAKVATIFPNEKSKCEDSKRDVETFPFGKEIKREEDCELKDGRPKTPSK